MNITKILSTVSLFLLAITVQAQVSFGKPENINDNWLFIGDDVQDGQAVSLNDSNWSRIDLPHDWSIKSQLSPSLASCTGYLQGGVGWYRKYILIPEEEKGKKVYLYFEGVYNRSEVFINGNLLGKRPNGYVSFMYDATPYIEYGKNNVIALRVDHSQYADSRWYTGSGIYRNVWLVKATPVHISQWGVYVYPSGVSSQQGTLHVEVEVENELNTTANLTIINELVKDNQTIAKSFGKLNLLANSSSKLITDLRVKNPMLWNLETPHLYSLKTSVYKKGELIDETITATGFRSFTFDPDKGFALNGKWIKVKGVCMHHDAGVLGAAVPRAVWERRLKTLKSIGCNAIRTSHNPQSTDVYELCNQLGLLVLNEVYDEWEYPKRKWMEGWNVGTPGFQGSFDYFGEWSEKDLEDIVKRDRNHLSIFAWGIGNEVDYPNDPYSHPVLDGGRETGFTQSIFGGYRKEAPDAMRLGKIAERLVAVVKKLDKSRPTTAGLAGVAMSNETGYPFALDMAGYNYTENLYEHNHKKYPNRVIYGSENRHDLESWKAVRDNEYIFGQFLWTGIDYLGESGKWPSRGFYSGLLDFGGFIKPRGYFRQSLWSDKPVVYIGTYPAPKDKKQLSLDAWPVWNYEEGENIRVVCYTNVAKTKLELNGTAVGELKAYDDNTGIMFWDIPYNKGKLEAIGMNANGDEVGRYTLASSKQPDALTVFSEDKSISKDKGLAQITLQVVDEDGVPVMFSDNEVKCYIEGPARLLGLESSNNQDMSDYTDNTHRVFHGRILAYIQATGEAGQAKVKFTSPWLKQAEIRINIK